jgi:hypothetical protein
LRTSRLQAHLLAVIAEGAFENATIVVVAFDHAERASDYAISASVANVRLKEYAAKFRADQGAGGTRFQASSDLAMLANVGGKSPG